MNPVFTFDHPSTLLSIKFKLDFIADFCNQDGIMPIEKDIGLFDGIIGIN